MLVTIFNEFEN